ncbi:hypothetical protein EDC01DRAFT_788711 [Geopyxis carbonaria]|nr:hypothetical protein EDC01DRAFT_788711 [Geopyxis carbonaria]
MVAILLLGGHGAVSQHITRILATTLHPAPTITSIIRTPSQSPTIAAITPLATPLVASLETTPDAELAALMAAHDWVIWSAGAGGKGGPERTKAVDDAAARRWFDAALAEPRVSKFLMVSANAARRKPAPWWGEDDIEKYNQSWNAIPVYCEAKCDADDYIWARARAANKAGFEDICLRPGALTNEPGTGKVDLGLAKAAGGVPREDVAAVAVELLRRGGAGGLWVDLVRGEEKIEEAVERVVKERVNAHE